MLAAGSVVIAGLSSTGAIAAEPKSSSTVEGSGSWYEQAYENFDTGVYLTPQQDDVDGPQRAPFGTSAHRMTIGESTAQTELYRTNSYDGVELSDLTRLEYSTLARRQSGEGDRQPTFLRLSVDTDDDEATDASLFFFPANNGPVVNGVWQNWDVTGGTIDVNGDNGGTTTLADYAADHPGAKLVNDPYDEIHDAGAVALITGGALGGATDPQANGEYFVDRVIVGNADQDTLFDFGDNAVADAGTTDLTVDPGHAQGWFKDAYDNVVYLNSNQQFVDGPGNAPAGGGSLRFALSDDTNPDRVELFRTAQYDGTMLRDLGTMEFSTFQRGTEGNVIPQQPAYLRLSVNDNGGDTLDHTLFFFPANNGEIAQSTWQDWDASHGLWSVDGDSGPSGAVTLEDYLVAHPDATIVENADGDRQGGGVAFLVGAGGAGQMNGEYFLDAINIGKVDAANGDTNTEKDFDLEPTAPVVSVGNARVKEGNHGATLTFPVRLSREVTRPVTVHYATMNGTAKAGSDYRSKSGTATIAAGTTSGTVNVTVMSDRIREGSDQMTLTLSSPSNATMGDSNGTGTIVNDDTRVGLALSQATHHRIRATVDTLADASRSPVKVYRVLKSGNRRLLSSDLNRLGRISTVLNREYAPGTRVTLFATVLTDNGLYRSSNVSRTVRR